MTIITIKRHRQPYTSETWEIHSAEPMDPTGLTGYMRSRADDGSGALSTLPNGAASATRATI